MTYDIDTLKALRERVREATGPDRELDADLEVALTTDTDRLDVFKGNPGQYTTVTRADFAIDWEAAPLTASIDAALALVERVLPGVGVSVVTDPVQASVGYHEPASAKTAPLAILDALLTALIEREGGAS